MCMLPLKVGRNVSLMKFQTRFGAITQCLHTAFSSASSDHLKRKAAFVHNLSVCFWFVVLNHIRNSKALGKQSGDSWRPIPSCWTSTASSCWIRVAMLLGLRTGRSASNTLMSKYTHTLANVIYLNALCSSLGGIKLQLQFVWSYRIVASICFSVL